MPKIYVDPPNALSRRVPGLFLATLVILYLLQGSHSVLIPPINIGRAQYEAALVKWNGLHVAQYEETMRLKLAGHWHKWKVVVHTGPSCSNSTETLTDFQSLVDSQVDQDGYPGKVPLTSQDDPIVEQVTVGGLFSIADEALQGPLQSRLPEEDHLQVFIQFDPMLGYPQSIRIGEGETYDVGAMEMSIENIRILKQCSN